MNRFCAATRLTGVADSRLRQFALALMALAMVVLVAAQPARAEFGIADFSAKSIQEDGRDELQAGKHPFASVVEFRLNATTYPMTGEAVSDGTPKELEVDLPKGFLGNPTAAETCTVLQLTDNPISCPTNAQVGVVEILFAYGIDPPRTQVYPVFNIEPLKGQVARFAFNPQANIPIEIAASVRTDSDYGIRARLSNLSQGAPFLATKLTLWGVPADPAHDAQRGGSYVCFGDPSDPANCSGGGETWRGDATAFLTNPTECGPVQDSVMRASSWEDPATTVTRTYTVNDPLAGCDRLSFEPTIDVAPEVTKPDAPTGLTVDLSIPQERDPSKLGTPALRDAVVTLPEGVSISPPEADGLKGCTNEQVGIGTRNAVACPLESKIGTVTIDTPLLAEQLTGSIYLGQPLPSQMFRIFLVADTVERGVSIRLEGKLGLDPQTGRVTTTFAGNPPLPFSKLRLQFKGGPRAPLATPQTCGTKTTTTQLSSYSGPGSATASPTSSFDVTFDGAGAPCPPRGFSPGFAAGLANPVGGQDSSFSVTFARNDYDQELSSVAVALPPGLLGRIADVPLCGTAQAATGTCGEGSRIGSVTVGSGAGSQPFHLPGRVYLTEGYRGGPFGMSIVVPALAGPFDLGTVVVRAGIYLDKATAQLSIASDPMPYILEGVPLRLRTINVNIDRPRFMFAPSNCTPSTVRSTISSTAGALANASTRFQVAKCRDLAFAPKMSLKVGARGRTGRGKTTPLQAIVTQPVGVSNLRAVRVTLPLSLNARLEIVRRACTQAEYDANNCARGVIGDASVITPLLRDPLRGAVYFVRNPARRLPDIVVQLRGQVAVDLVGKVRVARSLQLETTFDTVPDVPFSRFALRLNPGTMGLIGITKNLCIAQNRKARARLVFSGQNGKSIARNQRISIAGCAKPTKKPAKK